MEFLAFRARNGGGHCIGVIPTTSLTRLSKLDTIHKLSLLVDADDNMGRYAARNIIKRMAKRGIHITRASVAVLGVTFKRTVQIFEIRKCST